MRFLALAVLALFGLAACAQPRVEDKPWDYSAAQDYPWCVVYTGLDNGGPHCMFTSYDQCMMTATPGSGGTCVRNVRRERAHDSARGSVV